jgi:sigma-E factor negative regulatory protein RseB
MRRLFLFIALAGGALAPAWAEQDSAAVSWLERIAAAAQRLNYSGTFVYQSGGQTETSRITHVVDGAGQREKLEVLDGSPREVIRMNDEVRCFLPEERMVIVERQEGRKAFPARLPASLSDLSKHYRIRMGDLSRVAGFEARQVILEPKDSLRYGHMLWADTGTGLLLRARMVNERNEAIEQFYFTQLQIGGAIDKQMLKPRFDAAPQAWQVHRARTMESGADDAAWVFRAELPGFTRSAGMKRQLQDGQPMTTQYVFSDGLAAISVFIEPLAGKRERPQPGMFSTGAMSVYKRIVGDYGLILVGEVPPQTLKMLGDGIEPRKGQ